MSEALRCSLERKRKRVNAKAKGSRSERKIRDELLEIGWYVTKAGGSFGLWDLIAIFPGGPARSRVRVVQVKTNRNPSKEETQKLRQFAKDFRTVQCMIAVVRDRQPTLWTVLGM